MVEYNQMRIDVQGIIQTHGVSAILKRQTETTDTMGGVTTVSTENYNIYVLVQDITKNDRLIHEMGLAIEGNSKAFFFHQYSDSITGNGDMSVQVGDIIEDAEDQHWRVEQIIAERKSQANEIFRTAIIKRIDLD